MADRTKFGSHFIELPDNFEANLLDAVDRKCTVRGMVVRQQLLRLAAKGVPANQAAKIVGMTTQMVRSMYREPAFRKEVYSRVDGAFSEIDKVFVETKKSLHEELADMAQRSFEELKTMLTDPQTMPSLKVKIAQDFLDRNPETQAGHTVTKMNPAFESEQLKQAAKIARDMDNVIPFGRKSG